MALTSGRDRLVKILSFPMKFSMARTVYESKKKPKPTGTLRDQVLAAVLSEAARQAVKLIGTVALAIIMQQIGSAPGPVIMLV